MTRTEREENTSSLDFRHTHLGNSVNNFSNQISANIRGLGVNPTSDTSKHGNDGTTETISSDALGEIDPLLGLGVVHTEGQHGHVQHDQSQGAQSKSHDGSRTKGRVEAIGPAGFLGTHSRTHVGEDSHFLE